VRTRAIRIAIVVVVASVGTGAVVLASAAPHAPTRAFDGPACDGFDLPVGPPDADGYYDAQPFGQNDHLGNDWNGNGGGDSDHGDPVFSVASGWVVFAEDLGGGWGNVVRVVHHCGDDTVESIYAHLATIAVAPGSRVGRGDPIGAIGDAGGLYPAHLHLELRSVAGLPIGAGYGRDARAHLDPTAFIASHRPP
jgi:murein DD-endopeptidase MepM/ murein hydrolase activator NlpD